MLNGFLGSDSLRVIHSKHTGQQVKQLVHDLRRLHQLDVLLRDELLPWLLLEVDQLIVDLRRQLELELVYVLEHILGANNARYLYQLVVVVGALEERLTLKHHTSKHAARAPHVKLVIVVGHSDE